MSGADQGHTASGRQSRRAHIYNGYYDTLDQIFVSQEFYRGNPERKARVEYGRFFVDHLRDGTLRSEP